MSTRANSSFPPPSDESFLIVKLAAAGDVLLTTAMLDALRRARPHARIAWLVSEYAAPMLTANPNLDEVLACEGHAGRPAAAARVLPRLSAWRRRQRHATVLLAHRSRRLYWLLRAAGFSRIVAWGRQVPFHPERHRLQLQTDLLRAAGIGLPDGATPAPRLALRADEIEAGVRAWNGAPRPRWVLAPGGARNPWSAMPNRRWPRERFAALGQRARRAGISLMWLGGPADAGLIASLAALAPEPPDHACIGGVTVSLGTMNRPSGEPPAACPDSPRGSAAVVAAADLVIGNDSLPLVLAHALRRPALGLYGPTFGAGIHAPGQPFLQGLAGCGPCYDPRQGRRGQAYRCEYARCMDAIAVDAVWAAACTSSRISPGADQPDTRGGAARATAAGSVAGR